MNIILTNSKIYNYANALLEEFSNKEIKFPVKINFYLQKNKNTLVTLAQEIEKERVDIIQEYGIYNEETQQYDIPLEKRLEASKKIDDLFDLTQEVKIYKVNLESFGDMELTSDQMEALLFMINDEEELEE